MRTLVRTEDGGESEDELRNWGESF
jgi:hypothetical protein